MLQQDVTPKYIHSETETNERGLRIEDGLDSVWTLTSTTYVTQMWLLSCVDNFVALDIP